ncbi:MAG: MBL fold metallo-hydrolase [Planctomycetota bacterium]
MLPKPPPREPSLGFLYLPPYRVQGISIAGEATAIQIPELDLCFDMGLCPRAMLASKYVALTHGHMDHVGGLAYYLSQRRFQGMGTGTIICDARIEDAVRGMLDGYHALERQQTPYDLITLEDGAQTEIKNNMFLRAIHVEHTCPALGYSIIERRSKLREEFVGYPQEKLRELKQRGEEITRTLEIPLIAYTGDTAPGPHLVRDEIRTAKVVIADCTFVEPDQRDRARVGMHLHIDDIAEWLRVLECEHLVLVHVSRRTHLGDARKRIAEIAGPERADRVHLLMDHRTNRERYDAQVAEAERQSQ